MSTPRCRLPQRCGPRYPRADSVLCQHEARTQNRTGAICRIYRSDRFLELQVFHRRYNVPATGLPVYLLRCPEFYHRRGIYTEDADEHLRFILLSRVAIEICQHMGFAPDIFHCHDWHTALIPLYLSTAIRLGRAVREPPLGPDDPQHRLPGRVRRRRSATSGWRASERFLHQEDLAPAVVSFPEDRPAPRRPPDHRQPDLRPRDPGRGRIRHGPARGAGRDRPTTLVGILNGVDYDEWNPATTRLIPQTTARSPVARRFASRS